MMMAALKCACIFWSIMIIMVISSCTSYIMARVLGHPGPGPSCLLCVGPFVKIFMFGYYWPISI